MERDVILTAEKKRKKIEEKTVKIKRATGNPCDSVEKRA